MVRRRDPPRGGRLRRSDHGLTRRASPDRLGGRVTALACVDTVLSRKGRLGSADMPRLLIVHHTPSPSLQAMLESAISGARTDEIEGVEVVIRPALTASPVDVLEADGYLLGTPANIGYMSGALKHFFDGIYYPCLEATQAASVRPVRARRLGHRRGGARGGVDRHRPTVAEGQSAGLHHRHCPQ